MAHTSGTRFTLVRHMFAHPIHLIAVVVLTLAVIAVAVTVLSRFAL